MIAPEDYAMFMLKPNRGGVAKPMHLHVVEKIDRREAGMDVIHAMQESPIIAILDLLSLLQQEEWWCTQRDRFKVWHDIDARAYPCSLDAEASSSARRTPRRLCPARSDRDCRLVAVCKAASTRSSPEPGRNASSSRRSGGRRCCGIGTNLCSRCSIECRGS